VSADPILGLMEKFLAEQNPIKFTSAPVSTKTSRESRPFYACILDQSWR